MSRLKGILTGIASVTGFCLTASAQPREDSLPLASPEAAVEYLVSLRHGLVFLDDESQSVLERVKADPKTYVGALENVLSIRLDDQLLSSTDGVHRLSRALDLARQMGHKHTANAVCRFFDAITRTLRNLRLSLQGVTKAEQLERAFRNAVLLRDDTLKVLSDFNDPYSVDACVESVERERETANEVVMLQYLEKVAPRRLDIRPKLEEMYNSPTSPLRNNPQLKRVLDAMDATKNDGKPDENDRNQHDRERKDE